MIATRSAPQAPIRFRSWLWINFKIGALSFGSASRVLLYEEEVVRSRGWLSENEFHEALTLAQILPGPNLVNLAAALGFRLFPGKGAWLAIAPLLVPGAVLAILVALFVPLDRPWVLELFHGFAIGALLLMGRFLFSLFRGLTAETPVQEARLRDPRKRALKEGGRYLLAASGAFILYQGAPLLPVVFGGVALCLIWEFRGPAR